MAKRSQYKMMYREEWETDPNLRDWILPVSNDDRKARCKFCEVMLSAYYAGICNHAADKKHLKKMSEAQLSFAPFLETTSDETVDKESTIQAKTSQQQEVLVGKLSPVVATKEHELDSKGGIKYQKRWQMDSLFSGWLTPVQDDLTKAKCSVCNVELRAHYKDLERHAKTKKHMAHVQKASTAITVRRELTKPSKQWNGASESLDFEANQAFFHSDELCQPELNKTLNLAEQNTKPSRKRKQRPNTPEDMPIISSLRSDLPANQSQLLELECEAVDDDNIIALLSALKQRPVTNSLGYVELNQELNPRKVLLSSVELECDSNSRKADITDVKMKMEPNMISPNVLDLISGNIQVTHAVDGRKGQKKPTNESVYLHSAVSFKDEKMNLEPTDVNVKELTSDEFDVPSKRRKLDEDLTPEIVNPLNLAQIEYFSTIDGENMEMETETKSKRSRKKRATSKIDWKLYKKTYRREWEMNPLLSDWVAPFYGDRCKAVCKVCGCILRAHFTDLRQHCKTSKHRQNTFWQKNESNEPVSFDLLNVSKTKDVNDKSSKESKVSACYMMNKSPWSRYRKRYRKQWESDPQFRGWIASVPGDDTKARCKYCHLLMRAHYNDLKNHSQTTKHANNIAFGQPSDDVVDAVGHTVPMPLRMSQRQTAVSRKKKTGTKSFPLDSTFGTLDLNRSDDSLTALSSLVNISLFNWGSSPLQETTLILPKHVHLDETLAASLPKTSPGAMFRVKKEPVIADAIPLKKRKDKSLLNFSQEEVNENALQNLTRTVTLWEFLTMKVEKSHPNSTQPRLERILIEFKSLLEKVKDLAQEQLTPIMIEDRITDSERKDILMIESEELAQSLSIPVGAYRIKDPTNPRMTRNIKLLSNTSKRRGKQSSVLNMSLPQEEFVTNEVEKFISPQSLVIQSDQLQGLEIIRCEMDGQQFIDCSNMITINSQTELGDDGPIYAVQISDNVDQDTVKSLMQTLSMSNYTFVKKTDTQE